MRNRIVYNPRERKKYKHPSSINRKALLAFAVLLLMAAGVLYAVRFPQFQISIISISGNQTLAEDLIRERVAALLKGNFAFILPRSSAFFLREEDVAGKLKKDFPLIEHVEVKKRYPDTLAVSLAERKLFAIFCTENPVSGGELENISTSSPEEAEPAEKINEAEGACAYIDKNGFAYDTAPHSSGTIITRIIARQKELLVPSSVISKGLAEKMEYIAAHLPEIAGERVMGFEITPEVRGEFKVRTHTGFMLLLKEEDDPEKVLKILKTMLESEVKGKRGGLNYVDLRFGNKVFFKWK